MEIVELCYFIAALEQFKYQATKRVLLSVLEEYEDSGTTKKEDVKKTPVQCYHQLLIKHCMCAIGVFVVKDHGKQN